MKTRGWRMICCLAAMLLPWAPVCAQEAEWSSDMNKAKFDQLNGSYADAESLLKDSLDKAKDIPDKRALVFSNLELGQLYLAWNRHSTAGTFYKAAWEQARNLDKWTQAYVAEEIARQCAKSDDAQMAKEFRKRAQDLSPVLRTGDAALSGSFMNSMARSLRKTWQPPTRAARERTSLLFWLNRDGRPSLVHVTASSGDADEDARAVEAVTEAAPYAKLPAGTPEQGIAVAYTFNYKPASRLDMPPTLVPSWGQAPINERHPRRDP